MDIDVDNLDIIHNEGLGRFEVHIDDHIALIQYHLSGNLMTFPHTEVPSVLGGRGIASQLTKHALDYAVERGYKLRPLCWFVARYIERHPEYKEHLVA